LHVKHLELPTHQDVQLELFPLLSSSPLKTVDVRAPGLVGSGQEGERVEQVDSKSRRRIHGMLGDVVLLELWMSEELDPDEDTPEFAELQDAFCRVQARMQVVQAILWPSDDDALDDADLDRAAP